LSVVCLFMPIGATVCTIYERRTQ